MKVFDEKHIKNVAFVGAHNSGKTTLAETMLFEAGLLNRRGSVEDHNTVADYHEIEQERETSIFATPLHTEWRNYKINIIDTPGLDDFIGEIASTMRVADSLVTVINAQHGVDRKLDVDGVDILIVVDVAVAEHIESQHGVDHELDVHGVNPSVLVRVAPRELLYYSSLVACS